jgi:hypothetical protein
MAEAGSTVKEERAKFSAEAEAARALARFHDANAAKAHAERELIEHDIAMRAIDRAAKERSELEALAANKHCSAEGADAMSSQLEPRYPEPPPQPPVPPGHKQLDHSQESEVKTLPLGPAQRIEKGAKPPQYRALSILCRLFGHKYLVLKRFDAETRKVGCERCHRVWGMNDRVKAFVEWDDELEALHAGRWQ